MLDIDDIAAFAEVASAGGMTQAARRMGLSKSVLSRRLAKLEASLRVSLLVRTSRGVQLTEQGATFQPHAERMLAELAAGSEAVQPDAEPSGTLRIAAPLSFGEVYLAPLLAELAVRHPRLRIHAFYSDRLVDLIGERFDLGIRLGAMPDSSLLASRIATVGAVVVASRDYVARHGAPTTLDAIADHPAVVHTEHPWRFVRNGGTASVRPVAHFMADSASAILAGVRAGIGIGMLPSFLAVDGLASGELVRLLPDHPCPESALYAVRPSAIGAMPSKLRVLLELLRERLGKRLGELG